MDGQGSISSTRPVPRTETRYQVLYGLEPGQSVEVTDYIYSSLRSSITYIQQGYNKRFATRKQPGGSVIVWRLS
jgi:hypothetical protein